MVEFERLVAEGLQGTRRHFGALLLLGSGLLVRGVIAGWLPAGFDEAYYYAYTQHPSLSYFDHPPFVAFTTGFGPWVLRRVSPFSIRLGPLLLHTVSLWLLYLTGQRLFNRGTGLLALAIASCSPIFQLGFGTLTLPDCPLVFFSTACLYCVVQEFFPPDRIYRPTYRLAIASLLVGLACLGKYHGVALGFGLVVFCLLSRRHRRALSSLWTAFGGLLFAISISPVLIWNAQHDWASFAFQSGRAISDTPFRLENLLVTWGLGVAYLFPSLGLPLWWAISRAGAAVATAGGGANRERSEKYLLLLCVSVPTIATFTWMGGYRAILPTWPMPGFWGITILLGSLATTWWQKSPRWVWIWLTTTGLTASLLMLVLALHVRAGILQSPSSNAVFGGWIPVASDASTQPIAIHQLRRGIAESPSLSEALAEAQFVATGEWFVSGYVAMAIAPLSELAVTCIGVDCRGFAYWDGASTVPGRWGLYVETDQFGQLKRLPDGVFPAADRIGRIDLRRGEQVVQQVYVYRVQFPEFDTASHLQLLLQ